MKRAVFLMTSAMVAFSAITSILMAEEPTWELSYINRPKHFTDLTDRCLCVDRDGNPHIAYGGDHLYHAWNDGNGWSYEIAVEYPPTLGSHAAIALDESGFPHISFFDLDYSSHGKLKYAHKNYSGWHMQTVDDWFGKFTSIALDSGGLPHISYYDDSTHRLKYARMGTDGAWVTENVDVEAYSSTPYSSMALDTADNPHIVYPNWGSLQYASKDSTGWHIETVGGEVGGYASLALDHSDHPNISYIGYFDGFMLKCAHKSNSGWDIETASNQIDENGANTSIFIDKYGAVHISCRSSYYTTGSVVYYAHREPSGWVSESIHTSSTEGRHSSIAVDDCERVHIAFCADGHILPGDLKYARFENGVWSIDAVDEQGRAGYSSTSITLDASGVPHATYMSCESVELGSTYALTFASHRGDGWLAETVEGGFNQPGPVSLAFADSAVPCIAYSPRNGGLRLAQKVASSWVVEVIPDPAGGHRDDPVLAVDSQGYPHISYTISHGDIRFASKDQNGWSIEIVEVEDGWAKDVSLALDQDDSPHLAYREGDNADLKYAYRDGAGWHHEMVDAEGGAGSYASIALDTQDLPHIAYLGSGLILHYAFKDEVGWHTQTIDESGSYRCIYISLALDAGGFPHITYHTEASGHLKYAYEDELGWHVQTVDGGWDIGHGADLALSSTGVPHISYCHTPNWDVKYATVVGVGAQIYSPTTKNLTLRIEGPCPSKGVTPFGLFLSTPSPINVSVFDLGGRRVRIVAASPLPEGVHRLIWDGLDDRGSHVPSGTYFCSAEAGGARASARVVLIR